jgi:hypothetical protein
MTGTYYNRGLSWEEKHDLPRALADFKRLMELEPSNSDGAQAVQRIEKALNSR